MNTSVSEREISVLNSKIIPEISEFFVGGPRICKFTYFLHKDYENEQLGKGSSKYMHF